MLKKLLRKRAQNKYRKSKKKLAKLAYRSTNIISARSFCNPLTRALFNLNFLSPPLLLTAEPSLHSTPLTTVPIQSSVHNLTAIQFSDELLLALKKGGKFIPICPPCTDSQLLRSIDDFIRRLRIKYYFSQLQDYTPTKEPALRVRNSSTYQPPLSSNVLEAYYAGLKTKAAQIISAYPYKNSFSKTNSPENTAILHSIGQLKSTDGIKISPADKNLGLTITSTEWYHTEALKRLNDTTTYIPYNTPNLLPQLWSELRAILQKHNRLYTKSNEPKLTVEAKYILQQEHILPVVVGKFYLTIKMHKSPPSSRPIVNTRNTPTSYASKYLNHILTPVMKRTPTYLQNSQHLLIRLDSLVVNSDACLLAADVKDLYPSIPIHEGLEALKATLQRQELWDPSKIDYILDLAKFVLSNNIFQYEGSMYLQIFGTAMGTSFAPAYATIYLHVLEWELWMQFMNQVNYCKHYYPLLLVRYLDDLFAVFPCKHSASMYVALYNSRRPSIELIATYGNSAIILDLVVYKGLQFSNTNKLDTKLYQKEMNNYQYIPTDSYHSKPIFKGFIIGELRRYRLSCVHDSDFIDVCKLFYERLLPRGYDPAFLKPLFEISFDRRAILDAIKLDLQSNSNKRSQESPSVFVIKKNPRFEHNIIKNLLHVDGDYLHHPDFEILFKRKQPIACYARSKNVKELLCNSPNTHTSTVTSNNSPSTITSL